MSVSNTIKSIQDIMRKDTGVDGDAQRLTQLVWMFFLKIFDDKEQEFALLNRDYKSPIPKRFQWRTWAKDDEGLTGEQLNEFINTELFPKLKELPTSNPRAKIVRDVFEDSYHFGERIVAECLEPLKQEGWRIFHDVPAVANGNRFNLDHVAVGPGGTFALETKTRRKGNARPGFDDHKVYFDGHELVWPWGEDSHGLAQAEQNAMWLAKLIENETKERVHVTPILVLPGWFVERKPSEGARLCRVANPKILPDLLGRDQDLLTRQQIDVIAAKLEPRCRDVEY